MAPDQRDRMKRSLTFWYEFASTYSWLAAERIEAVAVQAGVEVAWRPFLLGPIFAAQGWTSSPFNLFPAKGGNGAPLPPLGPAADRAAGPVSAEQPAGRSHRHRTAAGRARAILPRRLPG